MYEVALVVGEGAEEAAIIVEVNHAKLPRVTREGPALLQPIRHPTLYIPRHADVEQCRE